MKDRLTNPDNSETSQLEKSTDNYFALGGIALLTIFATLATSIYFKVRDIDYLQRTAVLKERIISNCGKRNNDGTMDNSQRLKLYQEVMGQDISLLLGKQPTYVATGKAVSSEEIFKRFNDYDAVNCKPR